MKTSTALVATLLFAASHDASFAQIDPSIPLRVRPPQINDPLDTMMRAQQIRAQQQQQEAEALRQRTEALRLENATHARALPTPRPSANTERSSKVHEFSLWGEMDNAKQKLTFFIGFSNAVGLAAMRFARAPDINDVTSNQDKLELIDRFTAWLKFGQCILDPSGVEPNQAVAMIDKYYRDHPEKWQVIIGAAIMEALTVKGGPCPANSTAMR
jgi:hypothetical protein